MLLCRLLQLAFVLALIVVGASATLRLAANGIGCSPWPACYGRAATADAANATPLLRGLRLAHRVAASMFALVAPVLVVIGWRQWRTGPRIAGAALLVLTVVLAWVGRYTPSPLPAVTLTNLLGGFALLALLAFLLAARQRAGAARSPTPSRWLVALLAAVVVQAGGGALISARLAGHACASSCSTPWLPGAGALAHPLRPGSAAELVHPRAGEPLHVVHRLGGLALTLATIVTVSAFAHRHNRRAAAATIVAATAAAGLGFMTAAPEPPLAAATLHALAVGVLFALLGAMASLRTATSQETAR